MDSLYFNQGIFEKIVNGLGTHVIIKNRDAGFRKVLEHYSKRAEGRRDESFFAVCSELDMEVDEIREAAHWRWKKFCDGSKATWKSL